MKTYVTTFKARGGEEITHEGIDYIVDYVIKGDLFYTWATSDHPSDSEWTGITVEITEVYRDGEIVEVEGLEKYLDPEAILDEHGVEC